MQPRLTNLLFKLFVLMCLVLLSGCATPSAVPTPEVSTSPPSTATATVLPPTATPNPPTNTPEPTATRTKMPSPTPLQVPGVQGYLNMAYDSESDRIILLPRQASSTKVISGQTWVYDFNTNTWQQSGGPPRGEGPMAYDTQSDRVILFLGADYVPPSSLYSQGQTWAYDTNTDTWTNMEPVDSPYGLLGARMVYDSESDRMILFGGADVQKWVDRPDTWAYDYDTNTWTNMQPAGDPPPGDNYFAMTYDAAADRVIVWRRGYNSSTKQPDFRIGVYDYNTNTWEQRSQDLYPTAIFYNPMVYDPGTGLNIMYGGEDYSEAVLNETWGYDYATNRWQKILANNSPSARAWHAMVYDNQDGVIVMYGGGTSRDEFTAETWVFDTANSTWNSLEPQP